ncbi:type II secretion system minor pseudopilin GspK [Zooshikella harenae]|uniref:Type II secretion system minor pseudopilin GspK n=1 Tax=Zooshikella harenae TaxID=2827238 RepID=A0ABS5Z7H1_9GAMM|nr:type II secretion system minor pseudopilin GspK [Zooshikella harenae]MBU2709949.1 type II secretion system minor pseudopilin GspK [Zooshikella harenae]
MFSKKRIPLPPKRQRGVALIFVMVIFSLISVMVAKVVTELHFQTDRTSHFLMRSQARAYALAAEDLVAQLLLADLEKDKKSQPAGTNNPNPTPSGPNTSATSSTVDHLKEPWSLIDRYYPLDEIESGVIGESKDKDKIKEGDYIYINVIDLQGYINVNWLGSANKQSNNNTNNNSTSGNTNPTPGKSNKSGGKDLFNNLITKLGLKVPSPQITDWVDEDDQTTPGGGFEDNEYLLNELPYRAADRPMRSISELMFLPKMDAKLYKQLAPYLVALPADSKLNINTAPKEVLMSLLPNMQEAQAEEIIRQRGDKGFDSVNKLTSLSMFAGQGNKLSSDALVVSSNYFLAVITVKFADARYHMLSYYKRADKQVDIIARAEGRLPAPLIQNKPKKT